MKEEDDSKEMLEAKRTAAKGMVIVLIGTLIVLALALVTVTDPVKYMVDYHTEWWIIAGIGSVITFLGMGISMAGQQRQQAILHNEITALLDQIIVKQREKQE